MADERANRKMSFILTPEVKGSSHLVDDDVEATIPNLKYYSSAMTALI